MSTALSGTIRKEIGKGPSRRLRAEGKLPGVVYGHEDNVAVTIEPKSLKKLLSEKGLNALIDLQLDGDAKSPRKVLVKEYQRHPLKPGWTHIDFMEVDLTKTVKAVVPCKLEGHSPAEKMGGVLNHIARQLHVECLPVSIPEEILVPMADVALGDVVRIEDLKLPDGVQVLDDPHSPVVTLYLEKIEVEKEEGEEEGEATEEKAAEEAKPES